MCPCPEGDSPTTLRPFESLAAGCVPVFFVEKEVIAYDIPFPSLIDWDSVAFFARSMQEITKCGNGLQETFNFLDALGGQLKAPPPHSACVRFIGWLLTAKVTCCRPKGLSRGRAPRESHAGGG